MSARWLRSLGGLKPALILALTITAGTVVAQPVNDLFTNALVISGLSGVTNGDNTAATLENCEPLQVLTLDYGLENVTNSVWFAWTAPTNGVVEFNTQGSAFDTILSVWTTTNGLCDPGLTNLISDDDSGGPSDPTGNTTTSLLSLRVQAGTTYYIAVESYDDGNYDGFGGFGSYTLNWRYTAIPTVPSGTFALSSSTYTVSQTDSSGPNTADGGTVDASVRGARITVTRPAPAYGRVSVDYTVTDLAYTNVFTTNYYGTNIILVYMDTNGIISATNSYSTNIFSVSSYQSYNQGYQYAYITNGYTNGVIVVQSGISADTTPVVSADLAITDILTNLPVLTNLQTSVSSAGGGFNSTFSTNYFGYLKTARPTRGTNAADGSTYTNGNGIVFNNYTVLVTNTFITNYFGTVSSTVFISTAPNGPYYSTNYDSTNIVYGYAYSTNHVFTNGLVKAYALTVGTNWLAGSTNFGASYLNSSNYVSRSQGSGPLSPFPTNLPALGYFNVGQSLTTDSSGNVTLVATNVFDYQLFGTQLVSSANGIILSTGTVTFANLQMSQDFIVKVASSRGPDAPQVPWIPGYAQITLSNPQVDPQESLNTIQPPGVSGVPSYINALSTQYSFTPGFYGSGLFNFERSTFRVDKDVSGGNAVISVSRTGGQASDSVSVDYIIDPDYPNYGSISPRNVDDSIIQNLFDPANTFPLQAGSDYASPNGDYTPVSGTLTWGAYDYTPKQITIPVLNNGLVEFNEDMLIQLHNALPIPSSSDPGMVLGEVNAANLTILFDDKTCGQQPAGAVDRCWNTENSDASTPQFLKYPGTTPGFGGTVYAVAVQPDGNAIIAGSFVSYDSTPYNRIVRVLSTGYQDPSFQGNSPTLGNNSGANDFIAALALQPDGKILIGGNFTAFNGYNRHHIARLNSDGSVDTTFNPGLGADGMVWSIALQANGQLVIGGEFATYNGTAAIKVARLNADGTLDTTFNPGTGPNGNVNSVAVDASNRVVIGGDFETVAGLTRGGVARLNGDGSLDTTFDPGIGTYNPETYGTDPVHTVAVQPDGKILIGGSFGYFELLTYNGITRLNADGTVDLTFQPGSGTYNPITGLADTIYNILLQPDGKILIGGNLVSFNQTRRYGVARLFADGTVDTSFMDCGFNQFAGVPNEYFNADVISTTYPYNNTRNVVFALAQESGGNVIIGGSFEEVGGGTTRDDIRPRSNVARLIGGSTTGPGNIQFAQTRYSVANSEGTLYVSLTRSNGNLGTISATFTTNTAAPGPGVASGADFSLDPIYSNPTWITVYSQSTRAIWDNIVGEYGPNQKLVPALSPRSTAADVYINVYNPGNITGNLSANLGLANPQGNFTLGGEYIPLGAALGPVASAPLTIIDSNIKPGVIGFSSPTYSVIENGSSATIALTRTNGSDGAVSVWYATSNGTATNGSDYTGTTNVANFASGQTIFTNLTIPTRTKYTSIQPDKSVNLRLFTPSGGATLGLTNALLTLINGNYAPGHLSFSSTNYSANENGGVAQIVVNRLGGSSGTLNVNLISANNTAVNGVNYRGVSTNLYWADKDASARIISIPVLDDYIVTSNLLVSLRLTNSLVNGTNNATPLTFGGTNSILNIINVDSAGVIQFSAAQYSVKKYAGYVIIPVVRTGGSVGTLSVDYTTLDGTAVGGINYNPVTNILTFADGQVSQIFTVPIISSATNDLTSLLVQLSNPTAGALGVQSNATINIIDSSTVNETPGSVDTTYNSAAGFNDNVYALALQSNNQLLAGGDFTMADGVTRYRLARLNSDGTLDAGFLLPSSTVGASGSVRALAVQADGRILVGGFFTNFNSVAYNHITRLNADGTLDSLFNPGSGADNPVYAVAQTFVNGQPKILLAGSFVTVNGTTFNGIAQLNTDGTADTTFNAGGLGANATVFALAVQSDGKILIGGDFTAVNGATNFNHFARLNPDGSTDNTFNVSGSGASDSVRAIAVQLDGKILIGGVFTNVNGVSLPHIARLNSNGSVDTTFVPGVGADDAVLTIALQRDTRIVLGGQFSHCNGVTRNRVTRLNPDGSVDPSINFGLGANDFVAALAIQQDSIAGYPTNVPDEKILMGGGFTQYNGQQHDHLVRIFDGSISGSGSFQFSSASYVVDENGTNVLITVLRTGGTTNAATGDIFVNAATSDGSALAGINYLAINTNLDFPLGEVLKTFQVPVLDDGVITPNLSFNLAITNPTSPAEIGNQPTAVVTIINDDATVSFASATYSVAKNIVSGNAAIQIVRNGGVNGTAVVSFSTSTNGTAVPVTDYIPTNQTVVFAPGVSNVTVNVPINNNGLPEGNRTVSLLLTNTSGSIQNVVTLTAPTNALLTIIDTAQAPGQLYFAATNFAANSSSSNAVLTVVRTNGTSGLISATYYTVPGTAQPGVDYVATTNTVTFKDGDTNGTVLIPLINNLNAQTTLNLTVNLANPTGGATLIAPTNATLAIFNTNAAISFQLATNTVSEISGVANILVQRLNNTNLISTVSYATVDGTAVSGVNYLGASNILTFGVGEAIKSISISLINRTNTIDNTFAITLFNPSNAQVATPARTYVVEQASGAGLSLTTNSQQVLKSSGYAIVTVVCSNPRVEPVLATTNIVPLQVSYTTFDGTAKAGVDYGAVSGILVFTNGLATNTFSVPIYNNSLVSGNHAFSVALTNVTAPGVLTPITTQTVVIAESNAGLRFSQTGYSVFKNAGSAAITVYRTGFTDSVATVNFVATNGTALNGVNFVSTNGTLIFTNGVTSQSFNVPLIANSQVQPNLTVSLVLSSPTNGVLVSPSQSLLSLLENGGSYVIPAGSLLVTNYTSHASDGIIRSNDTVQVLFALRDSAGLNVTNLIAYLQATNGVVSPNPASQSYSNLTTYGHSVSRAFTFTAQGTNSYSISPTFQLFDNSKFIGTAIFTYTLGSWTSTFSNTTPIIINDNTNASPYPSYIVVSGLGSSLIKATVTLTNMSHASPSDLGVLVVSPAQKNTLLMGHAGGSFTLNHVTLTFDDAATNFIPQYSQIYSGTNKPTQYGIMPNFP